ncbi:MAG: response regulator transcription factor [Geminicoccaceae bacterium]|nr:response regulator transcription factor [Geminicoccaceae bacterium]
MSTVYVLNRDGKGVRERASDAERGPANARSGPPELRGTDARSASASARFLLIDPKPLRRAWVSQSLLSWSSGGEVHAVASAAELDLGADGSETSFDLVVLNIGSAEVGEEAVISELDRVRSAFPATPVVLLAERDDPDNVAAALKIGIRGYLPTSIDPAVARSALQLVLAGGSYAPPSSLLRDEKNGEEGGTVNDRPLVASRARASLEAFTPRQRQVLELLGRGLPNKVIARHLDMCESTVKVHVRQIMRKLGVSNRTEVALKLRELLAAS